MAGRLTDAQWSSARRAVLWLHRWLSLASCAVLVVAGLTGVVAVWGRGTRLEHIAVTLHVSLALGEPGAWVVLAATWAAVVIQLTGLYLWWRRKRLGVRTGAGWRAGLNDLHHVAGFVAFGPMLILAVTAVLMSLIPETDTGMFPVVKRLHVGREYADPVKAVYAVSSAGFSVQGVTGLVMWWPAAWWPVATRRQGRPQNNV